MKQPNAQSTARVLHKRKCREQEHNCGHVVTPVRGAAWRHRRFLGGSAVCRCGLLPAVGKFTYTRLRVKFFSDAGGPVSGSASPFGDSAAATASLRQQGRTEAGKEVEHSGLSSGKVLPDCAPLCQRPPS